MIRVRSGLMCLGQDLHRRSSIYLRLIYTCGLFIVQCHLYNVIGELIVFIEYTFRRTKTFSIFRLSHILCSPAYIVKTTEDYNNST